MAWENALLDLAFEANEDLSDDQYTFVVLTSAGKVRRPDSEAETALGILQNAPESGEPATVRIAGVSKLVANNTLAIGTFVMQEYVDATDAGKGKTSAGAPEYTRALVIGASAAEDDLCTVLLTSPFPAINDAVSSITTVTSDSTTGANTWSAAELIGGLLLRDPAGADRSDVTATAAQIVAGIAGCQVGSSFEFVIKNTADGDEVITLTAGAGVTLSPASITIRRGYAHRFRAVVTNATSSTEAVTIYQTDVLPSTVARQYSHAIADPGDGNGISVKQSGVCALTSAGAETRTLAIPTFVGQELSLICDTYVGAITLTVAAAVNQANNTILTFGAVADACVLKAMTVGGSLVWRVVANDGVALSGP